MTEKNKIIKIAFKNFYPDFSISDLGPLLNDNKYLRESNILLVIDNNNPDFIFYGVFGDFIFEAAKDNNVTKILFITEGLSPDFMLFDYCFGFEPYSFGDRYCYYPEFIYKYTDLMFNLQNRKVNAVNVFNEKEFFCDMVYSHDGIDVSRKKYFDLLNNYKRVESAGSYLNNQQDGKTVNYLNNNNSKYELQKKCKFSLTIQSLDKDWFINEKIVHSFTANQIPIFYGTKHVKEIFNPKRFIFVGDYKSDEDLLKRIIEIDTNDELYKSIIAEPVFQKHFSYEKVIDEACKFIYRVFSIDNPKKLIEKNRELSLKKSLLRHKQNSDEYEKVSRKFIFRILRKLKGRGKWRR